MDLILPNSMIKRIIDIFEIIRGFSFRTALSHNENGNIKIVQAGNIKNNLYINAGDVISMTGSKIETKAIIQANDVIVSSRGNLKAALAGDDLAGAVSSASTFILRPKNKDILPEYVVSFLNSNDGQGLLKRASSSALITSLSIGDLQEIQIPVPDLDKQRLFSEMYKNKIRQQELLERKKELVSQVVESAIKTILTNQNI
jgi:restriction endonuclease S subunit